MKSVILIPDAIHQEYPRNLRKIKHLDDWGDIGTVYIRLKKIDANGFSSNDHFGIYLGKIEDKFCVGRYSKEGNFINILECFDNLSELKHSWIID